MPNRKSVEPQYRDLPAFQHFVRKVFVRSPIFLIIMLITPLFRLVQLVPQEFRALPLMSDILLLVLREAAYVGLLVWLFPAILFRYLPRNVPYIVLHHGFFTALAILSTLALSGLHGDESLATSLLRFGRHQVLALFLSIVLMAYFDQSIQQSLGMGGLKIPVFWPVAKTRPLTADVTRLHPALPADIIAMNAQNQYVQIFASTGNTLLRMTLGEAIAALPMDSGVRVHRSWWVSHQHLSAFSFDDKAMELHAKSLIVPVSRARKADIAELFEQGVMGDPWLIDSAS